MQTPAYSLSLGKQSFESDRTSVDQPLVSLVCDAEIGLPAAGLEITVGKPERISVAPGDLVSLELGSDGALETVFTGQVERVRPGFERISVQALSTTGALTRLRVNQVYEGVSAGDIVSDLAAQAGVATGNVEDGLDLPVYAVSDRASAFQHCRTLAEKAGFDLYATAEDELVFEAFDALVPDHLWFYGRDLAALEVAERQLAYGAVEVWGESPASSEGSEAASWLVRDFAAFKGTAGSGETLRLSDPAIRTKDAATRSAEGRLAALQRRATFGSATLLGRAEVKLGDAVSLLLTPDDRHSGVFQVRRVTHRLSKAAGFTTRVELGGAAPFGLGGLP